MLPEGTAECSLESLSDRHLVRVGNADESSHLGPLCDEFTAVIVLFHVFEIRAFHTEAPPEGFEPPTRRVENRCSAMLSYGDVRSQVIQVGFEPTTLRVEIRVL